LRKIADDDASDPVTDVFLVTHGDKTDKQGAVQSYANWMNGYVRDGYFCVVLVSLHPVPVFCPPHVDGPDGFCLWAPNTCGSLMRPTAGDCSYG